MAMVYSKLRVDLLICLAILTRFTWTHTPHLGPAIHREGSRSRILRVACKVKDRGKRLDSIIDRRCVDLPLAGNLQCLYAYKAMWNVSNCYFLMCRSSARGVRDTR